MAYDNGKRRNTEKLSNLPLNITETHNIKISVLIVNNIVNIIDRINPNNTFVQVSMDLSLMTPEFSVVLIFVIKRSFCKEKTT